MRFCYQFIIAKKQGGSMIILNKMYSGDYLKENIGHEFINNYIDDEGKQYIYVNPWQQVRKLDSGDNYIIQVRYAGKNCYEVLSYAKIEKKYTAKDKGGDLRYGGHLVKDLLGNNVFDSPNSEGIYAHLIAEHFRKCKPNTYLCFAKNIPLPKEATKVQLCGFEFGKQNLRRYVDSSTYPVHYNTLINFINNDNNWSDTNPKLLLPKNYKSLEINFIDVVGKQYEELSFSNWLSFYLRNTQLCKKFLSECLSVDKDKLTNLNLPKREYHNIDIWLESENAVIVIENKIDSGLNGIKQTEDGKFTNQLEKYLQFAKKQRSANNQQNDIKLYFFVIKPNYNQLTISDNMKKSWKVIEYKSIHNFFDKISRDKLFKDLPYIQEFVKALKPLTQSRKIDYKDIIENRLMERIAALNAEKDSQ